MRKAGTLKRKEKRKDERHLVNFFVEGVISVERLEKRKEAVYRLQTVWLR